MEQASDRKKIILTLIFLSLAILSAYVFHRIGKDVRIFLPIQLFVLSGALLLPISLSALLGLSAPLLSALLFQTPVLLYDGIIMSFECMTAAVILSWLYRRVELPSIVSLLFSILVGRIAICAMVFLLASFLGYAENPVKFALDATVRSLLGIILQLVLVPLAAYGLKRYTTLGMD